ncbi:MULTISPECIES: hypothetical protein [unclassified Pseudomonas]|uniref:hypothetical protein n=1 Tax=unclassified Pseudomonas TaxID=196821 RepID=UPI001113AE6C|nr:MULTISPECIES: hypothetical protein [unclassified Pseudomonas]
MRDPNEVAFVLIAGGLFFLLGFIFIFGLIYLALFKMDVILTALRNSPGIEIRKPFMKMGIYGVYFMLISVGAYLTFPGRSIRGGELSEEDYRNFPRGLLRFIRFLNGVSYAGAFVLAVFYIVDKYMGWLK